MMDVDIKKNAVCLNIQKLFFLYNDIQILQNLQPSSERATGGTVLTYFVNLITLLDQHNSAWLCVALFSMRSPFLKLYLVTVNNFDYRLTGWSDENPNSIEPHILFLTRFS